MRLLRRTIKTSLKFIALAALLLAVRPLSHTGAFSSTLPNRYVKLSDSIAGHSGVRYEVGFDTISTTTMGSVEIEFCENDPFPGTSCTVPDGLDVSAANLTSQSGTNDFYIDVPMTNAHKIVLSRVPSSVNATSFSFELSGVSNPNNVSSQYVRLQLFSGASAGGSLTDAAGIAYAITGDLTISTTVPPYIDLCVGTSITTNDCTAPTGSTVDFGALSTSTTRSGTSQFAAATNADNGYVISVLGNSLTSGNNVIPPMTTMGVVLPGTNQFGMNLRNNVAPDVGSEPSGSGMAAAVGNYAIPDNYIFKSGDVVASVNGPDNYRTFTASYVVNIDASQPAGYYATTITYLAVGNY